MVPLVSLVLLLVLVDTSWSDCPPVSEIDLCGRKAMFLANPDSVIPTNNEELDQSCNEIITNIKCMRSYAADCIKDFPQQVMNMILTSAGKHVEFRCQDDGERQRFLEHVKCLLPQDSNKKQQISECVDKMIIMTEEIKKIPGDQRVPAICCSYHFAQSCVAKKSAEVCGPTTSEFFEGIFDELTDDAISFACAEFQTVDDCDHHMNSDQWSKLKEVAASEDPAVLATKHKYQSVVAPLLELIEEFKM